MLPSETRLLPLVAVALFLAGALLPPRAEGAESPENPEAPPAAKLEGWYQPPVEFKSIKYVVVTARRFLEAWQPLVRWKTRKGIPADAVAIEDILDNSLYRGTDGAETLRNFIWDLYSKWGLDWVLLGGDVNVVPTRMIHSSHFGRQATDLYFGALDGSWNTNYDGAFGTTEDRTDHVEEVFVGRVPVESEEEIRVFLKKFFTYIKPLHRDYQTRALLVGAILGSDATWDADDHYREIKDDAFLPAGFEVSELEQTENLMGQVEEWRDKEGRVIESGYTFGKSNERSGPSDVRNFVKFMNRGMGLVSHYAHSNVYLMGLGKRWFTQAHVRRLKNLERPSVVYSTGCQVNMFNLESISEYVLLHPQGGAVAFIGCTVNSTADQNKFERDFWEALFFHGVHQIGKTLAASKARRNQKTINIAGDPITILTRSLNLLGDPEMSIWTRKPADLTVEAPGSVTLGETAIEVKVASGDKPLRDARVCLWKEGEHHAVSLTDSEGKARLILRHRFPGDALLTVSARNHVPFEGKIPCEPKGAGGKAVSLTLADLTVADGAEGILDAGEKAEVPLALWNGKDA
ncbi:MAG: C25 family cysteine peptidase, partial [Planctomycetota bacterium]